MRPSDLEAVLAIENVSFSDPWPREWFEDALKYDSVCWAVFAEGDATKSNQHRPKAELAGYLIALTFGRSVHLANIAVVSGYRRSGIGRELLRRLYRAATLKGAHNITLEVRRSNHAAIKLYQAEGFERVGVEREYYEDGEDALVFRKRVESGG